MLSVLAALSIFSISDAFTHQQRFRHCSSPGGVMDGRIVVEDDGGQLSDMTTVSWNIGLGETLCYRFRSETSDMEGTVEVSYVSLKSIYSIMDAYNFPLVRSSVQCVCDCPGGATHCHNGINMCGNNTTNCHTYYNPSVKSDGCFLEWMQLSASVCCKIQIEPYNTANNMYRAVRLGYPNVQAQFRTILKNSTGHVIDSRMFNTDLNKGAALDWYMTLHVSSPGPASVLTPGWYVTSGLPDHADHHLRSGVPLNGLDTWDVTKLGWVKLGPTGALVTPSVDTLSRYFVPSVTNCVNGAITGHFTTAIINKSGLEGRDVTQDYSFISDVRVWRRHVELEHGQSPLLSLTLQHRSRVGVVVQYSASSLSDFTGVLYQDAVSNHFLNLTLLEAAGSITGDIIGSESNQTFIIRLAPRVGNYSHQVSVSPTECSNGQVMVTVRPMSLTNLTITKQLPCISHNMRTFRSTPTQMLTITGDQPMSDQCGLTCVSSWLYWLDPAHWMQNVWPQSRVFIIIILIIVFLAMLFIIFRICSCCCLALIPRKSRENNKS